MPHSSRRAPTGREAGLDAGGSSDVAGETSRSETIRPAPAAASSGRQVRRGWHGARVERAERIGTILVATAAGRRPHRPAGILQCGPPRAESGRQ